MVEERLESIVELKKYLPLELRSIVNELSCLPTEEVAECWDKLADALYRYSLWETLGYDEKETRKLVGLFRPVILLAMQFLAMDYLEINFLNEGQMTEGFAIKAIDNMLDISATAEKDARDIYNNFRKKLVKVYENTLTMVDPAHSNPFLLDKQNQVYLEKGRHIKRESFFPQIDFYLLKAFPDWDKFIIYFDNLKKSLEDGKISTEADKFILPKSFPQLTFKIISISSLLPGSDYVRRGYWDLSSLSSISSEPDPFEYSKETDKDEANTLIDYGYEDLFHLNRISYAIKKCIDYFEKQQSKIEKKRQKEIVGLFGSLINCPSVSIAEFLLEDVEAVADKISDFDYLSIKK